VSDSIRTANYVQAYKVFHNYEKLSIEEVVFGLYSLDGKKALVTAKMQWCPLDYGNGNVRFAAKLIIFDDTFGLLSHFKKLFEVLSQEENKRIDSSTFCQLLEQHGIMHVKEAVLS